MIETFGLIIILGFLIGYLLNKIKIPGLIGMICVGLIIGPYCLNLININVLNISSELRQIALVIVLTRSGLNLDIESLRKVGRPAILMCFIPATLEIIAVTLAAFFLLEMPILESILLGTVLSAVSPAVVSPRMIELIELGYGCDKSIPQIVLAGSSFDDVYVIVLFYSCLGLINNNSFDAMSILLIPVSIVLGIILGIVGGLLLSKLFKYISCSYVKKIIITLAISFLFIGLENIIKPFISISSLLGIMVMGIVILFKNKEDAKKISDGYKNMWYFFEIILFVLVGATIDSSYAINNSLLGMAILFIGLFSRSIGVYLSILGCGFNIKEKLFIIFSYLPKATVQASIGGILLSTGNPNGIMVLTVAVLAILISAPLGAILIDFTGKRFLNKEVIEDDCSF